MTDISKKLELIANLQVGEAFPPDVCGEFEPWCCAISRVCAEALAEIERLRSDKEAVIHYQVPTSVFWFPDTRRTVEWSWSPSADIGSTTVEPQPWGSPYAMNPENWT